MNYIINPWVFYLLNLLGNIEVLCWTLIITGLAAYVVYILVWLMADLYDSGKIIFNARGGCYKHLDEAENKLSRIDGDCRIVTYKLQEGV